MRKNSQYISISEYCKANSLKPTKFYETLSRHPELAKKLKTNAKGERVLDEKAITAAGAILRKENRAKRGRSSASSAADEINILAAKNEVLRKEVSRLKCENERLKAVLTGRNEKRKKTLRCKKGESQNDLLQNYPDKISRIDRFLTTSLFNSVYTLMNSTFAGFEHDMGMKLLL